MSDRTVLIVDDEPYNILGLTVQLSQMGFPQLNTLIDKAFNGDEALQMVKKSFTNKTNKGEQQYLYGLIFMDCSMPIVDGYDASDNIRRFLKSKNLP